MTEAEVCSSFAQFGAVQDIYLLPYKQGRHGGCGFVTFEAVESVQNAITFARC